MRESSLLTFAGTGTALAHHYRAQAGSKLMTESGVDALADEGIAFMGTNYL